MLNQFIAYINLTKTITITGIDMNFIEDGTGVKEFL